MMILKNKIFYIIFFLSFFIGFYAKAEIKQIVANEADSVVHAIYQKLGTGYSQTIKALYWRATWTGSNGNNILHFKLVECDNSDYTSCSEVLTMLYDTWPFSSQSGQGAQGILTNFYLETGTPYTMKGDKYYYIYFYFGDISYPNENFEAYGADNGYASTSFDDVATCDDLSTPCNFDYLFFRILNTNDVLQAVSKTSRLTPQNGSIINDNNIYFSGFYTNTNFDNLIIHIWNRDFNRDENTLSKDIEFGYGLPYAVNTFLNNGNYSYTTYLYNWTTGSTTAEFNYQIPYYFTIGSTTPVLPIFICENAPDLTEATLCAGIATSTFFGGVECGLKKVFAWAFYPDCETLNSFTLSYAELKQAFPFNAFFDLTTAISDAISTTTINNAGTLKMPFIDGNSDFVMLDVVSSSSLSNLIGQDNNNLFRNSITWILWLCAGFLIFFTIKKI